MNAIREVLAYISGLYLQLLPLYATQCSFLKACMLCNLTLEKYQFLILFYCSFDSFPPIHWVRVCCCQRIHITTCIFIHSGPITDALGCCYAGLLSEFLFTGISIVDPSVIE